MYELPHGYREPIEQAVFELMEDYDVRSLPINLRLLAERMGIFVRPFSDLKRTIALDELKSDDLLSSDGFSAVVKSIGSTCIFIADGQRNRLRNRFTVAHEVGHIWLEHRGEGLQNELEANYFAGYLLAPHPWVLKLGYPYYELSRIFEVSEDVAKRALLQARQRSSGLSFERLDLRPYELWMIENLALQPR